MAYTSGEMTQRKRYSDTDRLGTMMLALNEGVEIAAERTHTPVSTIYTWFTKHGGSIGEVRSFARLAAEQSLSNAARSIYEQVAKRAEKLSDEELGVTFRKLVEESGSADTGARAQAGPQVSVTNVQARQEQYEVDPAALAQALVTLRDAHALPGLNGPNGPA